MTGVFNKSAPAQDLRNSKDKTRRNVNRELASDKKLLSIWFMVSTGLVSN